MADFATGRARFAHELNSAMKGFDNQTFLILYFVSNAAAVVLLWTAWKKTRLSRLLFFLLFMWAAWTNWTVSARSPGVYLEYADLTFLPVYRQFIQGWFSRHIHTIIASVAICQLLIALSMLFKGIVLRAGCVGGIVFFAGIAPLGVGSAFPFSIIASVALYLILRRRQQSFLWISRGHTLLNTPKHVTTN